MDPITWTSRHIRHHRGWWDPINSHEMGGVIMKGPPSPRYHICIYLQSYVLYLSLGTFPIRIQTNPSLEVFFAKGSNPILPISQDSPIVLRDQLATAVPGTGPAGLRGEFQQLRCRQGLIHQQQAWWRESRAVHLVPLIGGLGSKKITQLAGEIPLIYHLKNLPPILREPGNSIEWVGFFGWDFFFETAKKVGDFKILTP